MMNDKEEERYLDRTIDASPVLAQIKGKRHTLPNGHDFESGWCDETGSLIVCLEENEDFDHRPLRARKRLDHTVPRHRRREDRYWTATRAGGEIVQPTEARTRSLIESERREALGVKNHRGVFCVRRADSLYDLILRRENCHQRGVSFFNEFVEFALAPLIRCREDF